MHVAAADPRQFVAKAPGRLDHGVAGGNRGAHRVFDARKNGRFENAEPVPNLSFTYP